MDEPSIKLDILILIPMDEMRFNIRFRPETSETSNKKNAVQKIIIHYLFTKYCGTTYNKAAINVYKMLL